jgi:hypothetical protein
MSDLGLGLPVLGDSGTMILSNIKFAMLRFS